MLAKDDDEHPLPEEWRPAIRQLVDAFVAGDFELRDHCLPHVAPIDASTAEVIADNISDYGEKLAALDDAVWRRSVCRWMDGYWQLVVDLTTEAEPVSDLALHARLYEAGAFFRLEIQSVHVP